MSAPFQSDGTTVTITSTLPLSSFSMTSRTPPPHTLEPPPATHVEGDTGETLTLTSTLPFPSFFSPSLLSTTSTASTPTSTDVSTPTTGISPQDSTNRGTPKSTKLAVGICVPVGIVIITIILLFWWRRHKQQKRTVTPDRSDTCCRENSFTGKPELEGSRVVQFQEKPELDAQDQALKPLAATKAVAATPAELPGHPVPPELASEPIVRRNSLSYLPVTIDSTTSEVFPEPAWLWSHPLDHIQSLTIKDVQAKDQRPSPQHGVDSHSRPTAT